MPLFKILINGSNCYLSLSGAIKDYIGSLLGKNTGPSKSIADSYKNINQLLKYVFGFEFIECHLTDETRRYTYMSNQKDLDNNDFKGQVLKTPIKFKTDFKKYPIERLKRHYSCCEKKIISQMDFVNRDYQKLLKNQKVVNLLTSYEFRIQKEPCRMCRPSLIGCYFIGYHYPDFGNFLFDLSKTKEIVLNNNNKKQPLIIK